MTQNPIKSVTHHGCHVQAASFGEIVLGLNKGVLITLFAWGLRTVARRCILGCAGFAAEASCHRRYPGPGDGIIPPHGQTHLKEINFYSFWKVTYLVTHFQLFWEQN